MSRSHRDWTPEIDAIVDLLREYYLDGEVADLVAEVLLHRQREGDYRIHTDEASFAAAVTADTVSTSGDLHLRLRYSVAELPERPDPVVPESGRHPAEARLDGHGIAKVERLPGNVGLVDIRRFYPTSMSRSVAVAAMHIIAETDALIIDLRQCSGGEPNMVALVCSFLFDERTHLTDLHFPATGITREYWTEAVAEPRFGGRKPIYVLTAATSLSAAEGLSYDLQQMGRGTLVGEVTGGAANFDYRYRVSPHLMFSVPSGYPINPVSGSNWEGTGVAPDIAVGAAEALTVAYRLALKHVRSLGADRHRAATFAEAGRALSQLDEAEGAGASGKT